MATAGHLVRTLTQFIKLVTCIVIFTSYFAEPPQKKVFLKLGGSLIEAPMLVITSKQWSQIKLSKYVLYRWEMHSHPMRKNEKRNIQLRNIWIILKRLQQKCLKSQQAKGIDSLLFQTIPRHYFYFTCEICSPVCSPCSPAACLVTQIQFSGIHVSLQAGFPGLLSLSELNCSVKEWRVWFTQWNYQSGGFLTLLICCCSVGVFSINGFGQHSQTSEKGPQQTALNSRARAADAASRNSSLQFSLQKQTNIVTAMWSLRLFHRPFPMF